MRFSTFCAVALAGMLAAPPVRAQVTLSYDVTTIKPHKAEDHSMWWRYHDVTFEATNVSLKMLIADAYDVKQWLVFGLPSWAESQHFDIQAKISEADPAALKNITNEQRRAMLVVLLKDRFGLQAHIESKEQPVFELTVMPDGIKFQPTPQPKPTADGEPPAKQVGSWGTNNGKFTAKYIDMANFSANMAYQVERTIINKTGLDGHYDMVLTWTPERQLAKSQDNGATENAPDIFTAMKEQLGLRLTPAKAPVPTVLVDKAVQPEAN